jgi:hypothetical protein
LAELSCYDFRKDASQFASKPPRRKTAYRMDGIPATRELRTAHRMERFRQKAINSVGVFNAINVSWDPDKDGYGDVEHGSSFMMAAQFVDGRCPVRAGTFVTYGQTENQRSPHADDYTRAYSEKRWNRVPFCRGEVRRKALSTKHLVVGRRR